MPRDNKVEEPKSMQKAWDETEADLHFQRNVDRLIETDPEIAILIGFVTVFNRRRRELQNNSSYQRIKELLDRERFDDAMAKHGQLGPTPETKRRRLRADVMLRLFRQKKIIHAELRAAEEIIRVRQAVMRSLFPNRPMEPMGVKVRGVWRGLVGIERLTDAEYAIWTCYIQWAKTLADHPFKHVDVTRLQIVLYVIEDNTGPRQVENILKIRHGTVLPMVKEALREYAKAAGFMSF